jgi:hypothetical protein
MDFRQAFGHAAKSQRNAGKVDVQYVSNGRRRNTNNFKRLRGVVPRLLSPREKCAFYFGGHALQLSDRCGPASTASGEIFRMNSSHSSCEQSMVVSGGVRLPFASEISCLQNSNILTNPMESRDCTSFPHEAMQYGFAPEHQSLPPPTADCSQPASLSPANLANILRYHLPSKH